MVERSQEPPPEPRRPKRDRNWDAYAAVIASLVGLLALLVSSYTAYLQRKQVSAQVWPHLELLRYGSRWSFAAINSGVGPARVKAVRITVDGKPVAVWNELLQAIGNEGPYTQSQISGRVIPPGQEIEFLKASQQDEPGRKMFDEVTRGLFHSDAPRKLGVLICYCSVLDECRLAALGKRNVGPVDLNSEEPIDACPIADAEKFRQ